MSWLGKDYARIVGRDLDALAAQVEKYPDDASLWRVAGTIKNAAGTLALHLVGNLSWYVGAVLGGTEYVRDRDAEFGDRGASRAELLARIAACREDVVPTLEALPEDIFRGPYPGTLPPHLQGLSTHGFLLHLSGHFMWHLGQVDYHRRILVEGGAG
ncbi:MAG: hypothetical protein AMXMBFR53_23800 [Gemmatimonadota bacterium]